ncbi:MAG TPA: AAA family ATPase [Acidimicrobiales bacterium]
MAASPAGINLDLHGGEVESTKYIGEHLGPASQDGRTSGIWERDEATAAIARVLEGARKGCGGSLFVVGEAGLGKSALLELARDYAGADVRIGARTGEPGEAIEPFAFLRAAMDEIDDVARPGGTVPPDRVTQVHQAVSWLERLGHPSLLLLDDCHWADADSLDLLVLICRRIATAPLGVIAALRPWPPAAKEACVGLVRAGHGSYRWLEPLGERGARALVTERAGREVPVSVATAAARQCAGNPFLLDRLGRTIGQGSDGNGSAAVISDHQDTTITPDRFAGVDRVALHLLEVASVFGERFRPALAAEVAGIDDRESERCFEALWNSGLAIDAGEGLAQLTHPLFRQALYDGMAPPVRAQLHARAFRALARRGLYEPRISEQAIRGQLFGDPDAIALFERLGRSALATGAASTAVDHLAAAVNLAAGNATVALRLTFAEALLIAGQPPRAIEIIETVLSEASALPDALQSRALRLIGWAHFSMGAHARAEASFREATAAGEEGDPQLAVEILLDRAIASWATDGPQRALDLTVQARHLASGVNDELRDRVEAAWGFAALRSGDGSGVNAIERQARLVENTPLTGPRSRRWTNFVLTSFAGVATWTERFSEAERVLEVARSNAEQTGDRPTLTALGIAHSDSLTRLGRLQEARVAAGGGERASDKPINTPFALARRAYILLQLGRLEDADACCVEAEPAAISRGEQLTLLWVWHVRAARHLGEGDIEEACQLYGRVEELSTAMGIGEPCIVPWARDALASYALCGRVKDARRVIRWLERAANSLPCRWPLIAAATGRAALLTSTGRIDEAEAQYEAALALHDGLPMPIERARTLLDYGSFIRHHGQPARARPVLAEAVERAEALSAGWLAAGARGELGAAGGRRRRPVGGRRGLTPSEERVTRLATGGASNETIAKQLSISVRTVETHLQHAYAKLGIRSRRQLMTKTRSSTERSYRVG